MYLVGTEWFIYEQKSVCNPSLLTSCRKVAFLEGCKKSGVFLKISFFAHAAAHFYVDIFVKARIIYAAPIQQELKGGFRMFQRERGLLQSRCASKSANPGFFLDAVVFDSGNVFLEILPQKKNHLFSYKFVSNPPSY